MSSPTKRSKSHRSSSNLDNAYKRIPVACTPCRNRKTKCLGGNPCQQCSRTNKTCVYLEGKKILISEDHYRALTALEARVKLYEEAGQSEPCQDLDPASPSSTDVDTDDINSNPLVDGIATLTLTPSGQRQFLGSASSTKLGLRLWNIVPAFETSGEHNVDVEVERWRAPWPSRRSSMDALPPLPPYDFAKRLYAAQFSYIGTIFSFLAPQVFETRLQEVYSYCNNPDLSDLTASLTYCQILMIFAFGQMYSVNQWVSYDGPPGFAYFTQAMKYLPDIHEEGSTLFVEVLSLVGYFMQNLNRRDAAFLYIGLAVRMAISLGLHEEVADTTLDNVEREYRRRLWWSVYSMDRILCVKSGNPFSIADEDIGVSLPSRIPDIEPEVSSATVLLHYTQLSQILGKIMVTIYRKTGQTKSNLVTSVQTIMDDLARWLRGLPEALRFDFTSFDKDISRESVSIFLHYYQCINMTARPLLFHVVQKRLENRAEAGKETDWRIGLSPTTVLMIDACVAAARDCTTMMASASKQNLWATFGFMDGEHAFSAALVLVMVNIAFAVNPRDSIAMNAAMSVLKGMAEKGNGHIRSRYQLLKNLQSMIHSQPDPHSQSFSSSQDPSTSYPINDILQSSAPLPNTPPISPPSPNVSPHPHNNLSSSTNPPSDSKPSYDFDFNNLDNDYNRDQANLIPFEAYENLDYMNMDIDWTLWTAEAARNSEGG